MIFKQVQQVLDDTKSQTRRPNFPYELAVQLWKHGWSYPRNNSRALGGHVYRPYTPWDEWQARYPVTNAHIAEANQILAEHIITLPVQPGRGKKAVGRIRITKIRREKLGDISLDDTFAEGIHEVTEPEYKGWYTHEGGVVHISPLTAYFTLWNSIYGNGAWERMLEDDMWVLDFERSER